MGIRSREQDAKESHRQAFTMQGNAGDYASERITFGQVSSGTGAQYFLEVMALIENYVTGATLELWLPQVPDGTLAVADRTDANYFNSGLTPQSAQGAVRWLLSAWGGAQVRAKHGGGVGGVMTVSASGF